MSTPNYVELMNVKGSQQELRDAGARALIAQNAAAIAALQAEYVALTESDIIVGALPQQGQPNKIYRVPNDPTTGKYSDYMYNAGALTTPVLMATYDVGGAIDDKLDAVTEEQFNAIFN